MTATLERGFKSWAERTAVGLRKELGITEEQSLNPQQLAAHLQVGVCTPRDVPGLPPDVLKQLLETDPWGWSAVSIVQQEKALVIYNPRHSRARQTSDIMHELSHIILGHQPATMIMSQDGQIIMRSYNQKQEDEANWLAWALLLPRDALLRCRRAKMASSAIAALYGVSEDLVLFRTRMTGVEFQLRAARRSM